MAKSIEEEYKILSQREHVIQRPDTYVGSVELTDKDFWVIKDIKDLNDLKLDKKNVKYIPAFIKIFDEVLTNASDHYHRGGGVKNIKVNISKDWNITVWNDGSGVPVIKHKEYGCYVPEIIFGTLLSGSNFNDNEERFGAGKNGYGSKLANIFSTEFIVDCADGKNSYYQVFSNNMEHKTEPKIKSSSKSYTNITFKPDLNKLQILDNSEDCLKIIVKRIIDIAAYNTKVKVYFNDTLINIQSIEDWTKLHINTNKELFSESLNDRWSICLSESSKDTFEQCSIVNGNTTWQGGSHVDYIMNKIVTRLTIDLTKGNKGIKIKPNDIKSKFHLFLISKIPNPTFDSQTKENLTSKMIKDVTLDCDLSDKLYKQLLKSDIVKSILEWVQMKEQAELNKLNKNVAGKTIRVEKLVDAHKAGTSESLNACICIAEGDSAKNSVMAGLSIVGRDFYGVFPIKGRPLNVRDATVSKITSNEEIANIFKIVGLVPGKKYTSLDELRYGKIIFFTDSDLFGISIKGLLINMVHKLWPELLELGFCYEFITPIVIAKKGKEIKEYYDLNQYNGDKLKGLLQGWHIKYYKGLGTLLASEMKEMFKNLNKHLIKFDYDSLRDSDKIDMVFNDKRIQERKDWLIEYKGEIVPSKFGKPNQLNNFIDTEFIQFSNYDNILNIPQLMDGLKPSQRKILYSAFKRNLKDEMKVAQFGAYIAETTHYAHGENSLSGTIVNMAQDFVGSNNINLFTPKGQFGTRQNPKSSASPRYIFTHLNPITRKLFRIEDDNILNYLYEDEDQIEPQVYLPIIPTLLVNGTDGIGTGWSTNIPKYSPEALIKVIKKKIEKPEIKYKINPSYNKFNGELDWNEDKGSYVSYGVFKRTKKGVHITELPIEVWTEKYINTLNKLCDDKIIKNYIDNSTDLLVNIEIIFNNDDNWTDDQIIQKLKLTSNINLSNMHTFVDNTMTKWKSAEDILDTWFNLRYKYYDIRKEKHTLYLSAQLKRAQAIFQFIECIINETIIVNRKTKDDIKNQLIDAGFPEWEESYDYLLNIPVYWFSKEKLDSIRLDITNKKEELKSYKLLTPGDIWTNELIELEKELLKLN